MKTAVIITGEMRTFDACLPTLHFHVLSNIRGPVDFFVATVADRNALKVNLLKAKYPDSRIEVSSVLEQPDCVSDLRKRGVALPDSWVKGRFYTHEPYAISVHPQAVARQLWQLQEGWKLFTEKAAVADYGQVIRVRPDLYWHRFDRRALNIQAGVGSPWWGQFGGINDRFAILTPAAAADYFQTFDRIPALWTAGCPFHPESLVAKSVSEHPDALIGADFSTLRENGEMRPPEISAGDYANLILKGIHP